jgi:hypothetical protein
MCRRAIIFACLSLLLASPALAQCVKIKDGTITDSTFATITTGYDKYGYNYQAHMFNGLVDNYSRPPVVVTEGTENLVMKWSDDWLANVDCDGDNKLDRGLDVKTGTITGVSQGWVTNHFEGDYSGSDGEMHHYTYFAKIVFVGPAPSPDPWAGTRIWGQYAVIEELQSDPFGEYGGRLKMDKLVPPGLGLQLPY